MPDEPGELAQKVKLHGNGQSEGKGPFFPMVATALASCRIEEKPQIQKIGENGQKMEIPNPANFSLMFCIFCRFSPTFWIWGLFYSVAGRNGCNQVEPQPQHLVSHGNVARGGVLDMRIPMDLRQDRTLDLVPHEDLHHKIFWEKRRNQSTRFNGPRASCSRAGQMKELRLLKQEALLISSSIGGDGEEQMRYLLEN